MLMMNVFPRTKTNNIWMKRNNFHIPIVWTNNFMYLEIERRKNLHKTSNFVVKFQFFTVIHNFISF